MFTCFECEHYIITLLNFSLKIQVWNILQCCIIALKELQEHKIQCEILAEGSQNISFVKMIFQYPHLKHKMLTGFFGWFAQ
jgi:hypothetical protein